MARRRKKGCGSDLFIFFVVIALVILIYYNYQGMVQQTNQNVNTESVKDSFTTDKSVSNHSDTRQETETFDKDGLEIPYYENNEFVVSCNDGRYVFYYDETYRQSGWVAYLLTRDNVEKKGTERTNSFRVDQKIVDNGWDWAKNDDYVNSGYDRGHLCPSADRDDSETENKATFYMSNIAPQSPALNRGPWRELEEQVRRWAMQYDSVYVVTGGVLTEGLPTFNGIGIPEYFYKVILCKVDDQWQSEGFIMPNSDCISSEWSDYIVTVDSVEQITGYDFYYRLPDNLENIAEKSIGKAFK